MLPNPQAISTNVQQKFTQPVRISGSRRVEMVRELMESHSVLHGYHERYISDPLGYDLARERYELAVDDMLDHNYTMADISRLLTHWRKDLRNGC